MRTMPKSPALELRCRIAGGSAPLARRRAGELAGGTFDRTAPLRSSNGPKLRRYRCRYCSLPHRDRDAGADQGFSFMASLNHTGFR